MFIAAAGSSLKTFAAAASKVVSRAPDVPPAMFDESPTTSAMTVRASFTDWSVHGISCFASWSYISAPAVRM